MPGPPGVLVRWFFAHEWDRMTAASFKVMTEARTMKCGEGLDGIHLGKDITLRILLVNDVLLFFFLDDRLTTAEIGFAVQRCSILICIEISNASWEVGCACRQIVSDVCLLCQSSSLWLLLLTETCYALLAYVQA